MESCQVCETGTKLYGKKKVKPDLENPNFVRKVRKVKALSQNSSFIIC